jgi:hypothetical protein
MRIMLGQTEYLDVECINSQPVHLAGGWCWFVLKEKYCWLVADGWFAQREKYCWLVADKPSEQGVYFEVVN